MDARARSFGRFADAYERVRPGYPAEAANWLTPGDARVVVELGAGTGKLTRLLVRPGRRILAVEPDARMRGVLEGLALAGVEPLAGSGEAIPLPGGVADAVVSGSAFHWFDLDAALAEIARVLVRGGTLAFAWNHRDDTVPWVRRLTEAIRQGEQWLGDRPWVELIAASGLFGPVERADFRHVVSLPREALPDYLRSYSRVGAMAPAEQEALVANVADVLAAEPELADAAQLELPFVVEAYRTRLLGA